MFKERSYRQWIKKDDLIFFEVKERQTDLGISARRNLKEQAREAILVYRSDIENYIKKDSAFLNSLEPIDVDETAPEIVRVMAEASSMAGVGPMAAVAGAIAEFVGRDMSPAFSDEIIVENGGDIFMRSALSRVLGVYAGDDSPFTGKIALEIAPAPEGVGVCTSSGTVSHSLSFGKADACVIISDTAALADAAATATANIVKTPEDIGRAIEFARSIEGVDGVLILARDKMGSWGKIKLL